MRFICPECGFETDWTERDFVDRGNPVCPDDDNDMEEEGEDEQDTDKRN